MTTVLVFGAFDPLHPGHAHFLSTAAMLGDKLAVVLATDASIRRLKGHEPRAPYEHRKQLIELLPLTIEVVPSDEVDGSFAVVDRVKPDFIAFGYDQQALEQAMIAWREKTGARIHFANMTPHKPEMYKSSLLR